LAGVARDDLGEVSASSMALLRIPQADANRPFFAISANLPSIDEDAAPSMGEPLLLLMSRAQFGDADGDVPVGIAISANFANPSQGQWQYSLDTLPGFWHDVGLVTPSSALMLDMGASLRFVPAPNFN